MDFHFGPSRGGQSETYNSTQRMMGQSTQVSRTSSDKLELQQKIERQNLIIQTLLMILLEKKVIYEEEFKEWMDYVDGLDGKVDGRLEENKGPVSCPECGRKNPPSAAKCQYCMHELPQDFLFRRDDSRQQP